MKKILEFRRMREKRQLNIASEELAEQFDPQIQQKVSLKDEEDELNYTNTKQINKTSIDTYCEPSRKFKKAATLKERVHFTRSLSIMNCNESEDEIGKMLSDTAQPMEFRAFEINGNALYDKGCVTCGNENYKVKYHGERHVCYICRKHIKTQDDEPVLLYQDGKADIKAYVETKDGTAGKKYEAIDHQKLKIFEYRCYATYSGPDELIVQLHDEQPTLFF